MKGHTRQSKINQKEKDKDEWTHTHARIHRVYANTFDGGNSETVQQPNTNTNESMF